MEKTVKARKEHVCHYCEKLIEKGQTYRLDEWRGPKHGESLNQVGVWFHRNKWCLPCLDAFKSKVYHGFEPDGSPTPEEEFPF